MTVKPRKPSPSRKSMKVIFITPEKSTLGFEPIMWLRSQEMIQILRNMGVEVSSVDVSAFSELLRRNSHEVTDLKSRFIIAPNFNYFLLAAADGIRMLDSLEKPILALWDDPLGALANFVTKEQDRSSGLLSKILEADPTKSIRRWAQPLVDRAAGARRNFSKVMRHPLMKHFSWDTGHIKTVDSLGLVETRRVVWHPIATYSAFLSTGRDQREMPKARDVGFCGNVYLAVVRKSGFFKDELLRELTTNICNSKLQSLNKPIWSLMVEEIEKLPSKIRSDYGLYDDKKPFWDYYIFVVWQAANTLVRLGLLGQLDRQVNFYGLFADPESVDALKDYPNLKYEGIAHHFNDLPGIYASTKINICISNGLVYNGIPSKLIDCLASGGFALTDPKEDLVRFFGPTVERIFFRNVEELNSKIEYYLTHPVERDEIVRELGAKVHRHCTLDALFQQVMGCIEP